MGDRAYVLAALNGVYDPELDEPITTLRFVSSCEVSPDGDVDIHLRLPTPQCAPNFAYLMAADARDAVRRLPGVRHVNVVLEDHYTGEEISESLRRGDGFAGAFPGETVGVDLEALRNLFLRKALVARQARICESLLAAGACEDAVASLTLAELPDVSDARRCRELRDRLHITCAQDAPAFVTPGGDAIPARDLRKWLRTARLVRMSLEANGGICRSLLQHRYDLDATPEEVTAK
jgi:metal-sulfur cluster biosynthetic enzyme